jgi:hypothetical protein
MMGVDNDSAGDGDSRNGKREKGGGGGGVLGLVKVGARTVLPRRLGPSCGQ